jgi:hypothetical protein
MNTEFIFHQTALVRTLVCLFTVFGAINIACSQRLIDDFTDGVDDGWAKNTDGLAGGHASGRWAVEDGVYRLSSTRPVDPSEPGLIGANWGLKEPTMLGEGVLLAKVSPQSQGMVTGVILGSLPLDDVGPFEDYYFFAGSTYSHNFFGFRCENELSCSGIGEFPAPIAVGDEWWMEAAVADGKVSLATWLDGDDRPDEPQLVYNDRNMFTPQQFGIGGWIASSSGSPAVIDMTFDDIYFTPLGANYLGDFDADWSVTVADLDVMKLGDPAFDVSGDGVANSTDRDFMVQELVGTWYGDSNGDGEFNSSDFVQVFALAKYETGEATVWSAGDWNLDGVFDSNDFVIAFFDGGYELGAKQIVNAVPEPSASALLLMGLAHFAATVRTQRKHDR